MKSSNKSAPAKPPTRNLRFLRNERRIIAAFCVKICERRINIKAKELYGPAHITAPTFYLHYHNSNDVRISYENQIITEIDGHISKRSKPHTIFAILISHIIKNRTYFLATNSSRDLYLLTQVLFKYRINLVGDHLNDRSFLRYVGKILTTITIWLEYDEINARTAQRCIKDLSKIQP